MPGTLIRNGHVVTVDGQRNVFAGGFVAIEGGRIVQTGPADKAPPAERFETIIDATGCIVTPGLINMHQHHWYTLFKGMAVPVNGQLVPREGPGFGLGVTLDDLESMRA